MWCTLSPIIDNASQPRPFPALWEIERQFVVDTSLHTVQLLIMRIIPSKGEWTSAYGRCEKLGEGELTTATPSVHPLAIAPTMRYNGHLYVGRPRCPTQ